MASFLARSSMPHALELRGFINANLGQLPTEAAAQMCRALHGPTFRPALFELVVARTLQLLEAGSLTYQRESVTGRRPDLEATFDDGRVVVDATVPDFDASIVEDQATSAPLIDIVETEIPAGWTFFVELLPRIGPNESRREFKTALRAAFAKLPASSDGIAPLSYLVVAEHPQGEIRLRLGARPRDTERAYGGGPASVAYGNTDARVEKALRRKRSQLRGGDAPALVAIAGGMGEGIEDFDMALFGSTWERQDGQGRVVETGFHPTGIWGKLRGGDSVLAGVLAYCHWQWSIGTDPVLYLNPRFEGRLPLALRALHVRWLLNHGIESTPATSVIFARMAE